jgi:hypothetical protein
MLLQKQYSAIFSFIETYIYGWVLIRYFYEKEKWYEWNLFNSNEWNIIKPNACVVNKFGVAW